VVGGLYTEASGVARIVCDLANALARRASPLRFRPRRLLYRCDMNKKIRRNFEVFTPRDFIAAITQHTADKSFQLVRYYGWYSNQMRDRRAKRADEEVETEGDAVEAIDVSAHEPRRIPSKKWRDDPRSVARRPFPDYDTEPVMAFSAT